MSTNQTNKTIDLLGLLPEELTSILLDLNEPKYRAKQFFHAIHKEGALSIEDIETLKKTTRAKLLAQSFIKCPRKKEVKISKDQTRKYQFETHDGHVIESVFIPNAAKIGRHALCVSSQVGCAMKCTFCATAALKLKRNLFASEIVYQVYLVMRDVLSDPKNLVLERNQPIHNIVFMGMGEPLHNFNNLLRAIELLNHENGLGFSPRRLTVSTSGLVPKIKELGEKTGVYLAISLNATTNEVRNSIMPVNKKWQIEELINAAKDFPNKIRERITFEYVLLKDVNDKIEDALRLVRLLKGIKCKINLIPFNEHPLSPYKQPDQQVVLRFHKILHQANYSVFVRKTRGEDIDAACGMLGAKKLELERKKLPLAY